MGCLIMNNQLTSQIKSHYRCDRCDNILNASLHKGVVVALAINIKGKRYYCVRCMKNVSSVLHRTDEQLDSFVNSLMVVS